MKISIVVTYLPTDSEVEHLTTECLRRINQNTFYPFELIRVNNDMFRYSHETRETAKHAMGDNIFINNHTNFGNGKAWDQGVEQSSGDIIILMDNDVWVEKDWDKEMIERLFDPNVGIAFPYSIVGDEFDKLNSGFNIQYKGRRDGFCFAFKRNVYNEAGPFLCDQPFVLGYYEDDWFEYRVQYNLGLQLVACESSRVWHKGQSTSKKIWNKELEDGIKANKEWFEKKSNGVYPYVTK